MKSRKMILLPIFITLGLIVAFIYSKPNIPSLYSLQVIFDSKKRLEIKICNPTYEVISFNEKLTIGSQNNILYGDEVSIVFKPYMKREEIINGPFLDNPSYGMLANYRDLEPKECVSGFLDIKQFVPIAEYFRVRINLYEYDDYRSEGKKTVKSVTFESQKFFLNSEE